MALYFVTGNPGKLLEAQRALGRFGVEVRGAKADFDEPRSDDLAQIARAKVRQAAAQKVPAPFFVQDAGFFIDALRGFPGTNVNFVLRTIGVEGIAKLMAGEQDRRCRFRQCVAYWDGEEIRLFSSETAGSVAQALRGGDRPEQTSPLGRLFIPDGADKTTAEFTQEELNAFILRDGRALTELGRFLQEKERKD